MQGGHQPVSGVVAGRDVGRNTKRCSSNSHAKRCPHRIHVHPYMPVLDLQEFFDSIRQTQNSKPVSLILLQAILFAGCVFVEMPLLERTGYQTRRDARKVFYVKVKYLYELDWELDSIPVIQALLLITY
ncbi:hypothetical protein ETB97_005681 [Aspergillus alliaceus]|uniref:Xylanolytic transcriptional activator regulatory domain-containing protein n=1 Tax=Petromyces alliaceus TaxID=209559 RepID=A0A8H5ZXH6_PETAA|nr:hypothetical protein ETB97_005681 [Aspergillus burnettii]